MAPQPGVRNQKGGHISVIAASGKLPRCFYLSINLCW
jgi:hypothetical protein